MVRKQMAIGALVLLFAAVFCPAASAEARVSVEAGEIADYGVNIPFTPSPRAGQYTFEVFDGENPQTLLLFAQVTADGAGEQNVYLPLAVDPGEAHGYILQITAHPAPERAGLDSEASVCSSFTTRPSCGCEPGTAGAFYAGAGTAESPWRVTSLAQLRHIGGAHLDGAFLQTVDIRLDEGWSGVGTSAQPFAGRYDGGYHRILFPQKTLSTGVFGGLLGAEVTSLGVENAVISTSVSAGALSGSAMGSTRVTNCYSLNPTLYGYNAGGLISTMEGCTLENCYVLGSRLNAEWEAGGIIGRLNRSGNDLDGCYAIPASGGSPKRGSFALVGNSSYTGTGGHVYNSYWCNSPISAGVGGSVNDGGGYGTPPTLHAPSKGLALDDFSSLDNLNFDSGLWEIRTMTFNTASGSVTKPVPVLKGFYAD